MSSVLDLTAHRLLVAQSSGLRFQGRVVQVVGLSIEVEGLRLPLGSLAASPSPPLWADDPSVSDPRRDPTGEDEQDALHTTTAPVKRAQVSEPGIGIRTALAIEPRDGLRCDCLGMTLSGR